jgi:DNA-binding transcriptional ArsR family regulator
MMSLLPSTNAVDTEQHGDPRVVGVDDEQLDDVLDAISSDTARTLLSEIYSDSGTPSELSDRTNFSLQNISYHLDNLEDSGLIRVAGTRYSEKGREMNIYAPAEEPVVVFVGTQERKSGFLDLLKRVFGAVVVLVAATAYVFVETFGYSAGPPGSGGAPSGGLLDLPFIAFLVGGLFVLLLVVLWGAWTRIR